MNGVISDAWRYICRRRGRSALIVSGITVGVLMVTLVCLIGSVGTDLLNAEMVSMGLQGISVTASGGLTSDDLATIRSVDGVSAAMPLMTAGGYASLHDHSFSAYIGGIDAGADQVVALETLHGRLLRDGDVASRAAVCMVDEAVALAAYGRSNVIGKTVTVTVGEVSTDLQIVGVAKAGSSLLQNVSGYLSGLIYLPYTTLQELSGKQTFTEIAVQAAGDTADLRERVVRALERGGAGTYKAEDLAAQRDRLSRVMDTVSLVLTAIAGVSLLVAGTGMLTAMLTAVGERVREIGVKQAIGATARRIRAEFLCGSLLLAAIGGTVGMAMGLGIGAAGLLLAGLSPALPITKLLIIWLGTVLLGGVFGWYPAQKAAALSPATALRNEIS